MRFLSCYWIIYLSKLIFIRLLLLFVLVQVIPVTLVATPLPASPTPFPSSIPATQPRAEDTSQTSPRVRPNFRVRCHKFIYLLLSLSLSLFCTLPRYILFISTSLTTRFFPQKKNIFFTYCFFR
jgi:hypothetical protein